MFSLRPNSSIKIYEMFLNLKFTMLMVSHEEPGNVQSDKRMTITM